MELDSNSRFLAGSFLVFRDGRYLFKRHRSMRMEKLELQNLHDEVQPKSVGFKDSVSHAMSKNETTSARARLSF